MQSGLLHWYRSTRVLQYAVLLQLLFLLVSPSARAQDLQRLLDEWNILRSRVADRGINLEVLNTMDILSNVSGGLRNETGVAGDFDLLLTLDGEKLVNWDEATVFAYGLGLYGDDLNRQAGELQTVSGIAAPNTWKLFEAWYQQNLLEERVSLLLGLYDVTSEFDVLRSASELFVNSSFGTNPTFALSGVNGPSTFPVTALAFRGQAVLTEAVTLRAVVADGVAGDPDDPNGTRITLKSEDGVLVTTEMAYYRRGPGDEEVAREGLLAEAPRRLLFRRIGRAAQVDYDTKVAIGGWLYTTELDDLSDVDPAGNPVRRDGTYGIYGLAEHTVYRERGGSDQGLQLFAQAAYAEPRVNRLTGYVGGGLVYTGLLPGRTQDQTGFGFTLALSGSHFKDAQRDAGNLVSDEEVVFEFTHALVLAEELIVQPDIQYIINPGTNPQVSDALVLGARLEIHMNFFQE